jgi:ppGpp synthetase/RelA/SpoT-type nucleotidyltranferase
MRARRVWQVAGTDYQSQIDQLHVKLAAFNKRIEELEKINLENSMAESLKASAILIARQIDEIRCSIARVCRPRNVVTPADR